MEQLEQLVGVSPSTEWLDACRAHLQSINEDTPDAVLHQILHTDLRDVVRVISEDASPPPEAANALRRAVQSSNNSRQVLPESFRLLFQVEEVLDVSLNAEARISVGPASRTNPTPIGNQRNRCLKLSVSDGYTYNGSRQCNVDDNNNTAFTFTAVEISPIPNLSVHSKAGVKVLVKGPVDIRFGVIMWHQGNSTVLGGCVPSLMEIQQKALEQAKRVAGIGVDPTVRALIWNPHTGDEQEQDEGEHESRDVTVVTPPPTAAPVMPPAPTPVLPVTAAPVPTAPATVLRPPPLPDSNQRSQVAQRTNLTETVSQQRPTAVTARTNDTPQAFSIQSARSTSPNRRRSNNPYRNPYASASSNGSVARSTAPQLAVSTTASVRGGAVDSPVDLITPTNEDAPTNEVATSRPGMSRNETPTSAAPQEASANPGTAPRTDTMASSQDTLTTADEKSIQCLSQRPANSGGSVATAESPVETMSFSDLKALLIRLVKDRELYRKYESTVFVVQAKMKGGHRYFNIDKRKKNRKKEEKKKKQYEYVMNCNIGGPNDQDGTITCKVASSILEPLFGVKPGEMRKLNRADKAKSKLMVEEGGRKVKAELLFIKSWQMMLFLPSEEFFAKETTHLNGDEPIMIVMRRHDL